MTEFDIIKHYFTRQTRQRADVALGIGDDATIVNVPVDKQLVITTDTLSAGIHFPSETPPNAIGHKALAVNLSDLAAMGAHPAWITLSLTLPSFDAAWLNAFCDGFFALANTHDVALIGGDLTHGPLSITVAALGLIPAQKALLRSAAKPNDLIYVTGTLGDAGLALLGLQQKITMDPTIQTKLLEKLNYPTPRVKVGEALQGIAHAAIDVSDGLASDLSHILDESNVGARINVDQLPLSDALKTVPDKNAAIKLALSAGDDYELCFTIPPQHREQLTKLVPCRITCIGEITAEKGLLLHYQQGNPYHGDIIGYQHF